MAKLDHIKSKICSWESLKRQCNVWRFKGKKIVFTNGCFDLLHLGHIEYLSAAADLGDVLIVGLNTDDSVRKIKGNHRPVTNEHSRSVLLASLFFVDAVVLFNEETPYELIKMIRPDILVKGKDYLVKDIVGHDIVEANGGKIITVELTKGYSTSKIEEHILRLHKK
jgi:D-glycero-beta-D-manno-heptose 1-phosphate adenylyltransferase